MLSSLKLRIKIKKTNEMKFFFFLIYLVRGRFGSYKDVLEGYIMYLKLSVSEVWELFVMVRDNMK